MDVSMIQSPSKRQKELQKLVVLREDVKKYNDIFELFDEQKRAVELIFVDRLDELSDWSDLTFFCGDFQSELYTKLTQNQATGINAHLIVGPAVLRHRLQTNQEMMTLRPCRPLYCELMKNVTMKLSTEVTNKKDLVELVHFMGGSVRKDTVQRTNVLIAGRASGKFSACFDIPILRAGWIIECWKHRDNPYYDVFDAKLVAKYKLGVFEGLSLYFHGFKQQDIDDMVKSLKDSEGTVADRVENATHVVYNSSSDDTESLPNIPNQMHVTQEWYWVSLHRGSCAFEENFALPTKTLRRKFANDTSLISGGATSTTTNNYDTTTTATPMMINSTIRGSGATAATTATTTRTSQLSKSVSSMRDCSGEGPSLNATPDYIYSNDDMEKVCKSPRVVSKRLQVCMEMVDTETNYVNQMKLIVKLKMALEQEISQNEFMKKSDVSMIFGKLEPILEVHQKILNNLNNLLNETTSILSSCNGKKTDDKNMDFALIWIEMKEEMKKVYPPYLNSYDTAKTLFDTLDRENSKFHTFCKAKESNPDFRRLKLNDLMVKPVQRLPSVILLLREMGKKSESSRLKNSAEEAAKSVDEVLKIANKTRERNDNLISHMSKFTDIENVPPHLVASNRMFIRDIVVNPIASTSPRLQQFNQMKLFLFHDVMLITKIRSEKNTMQRFARHASFASLHSRTRRPYKYIEQISLSSMRSAVRIRPPDDYLRGVENMPMMAGAASSSQNNANKEPPHVWCLIHRDEQGGDTETVFEAHVDEEIREFLDDIHLKILSNYGRYFYNGDTQTTSILSENVADLTLRHFRRQMMGAGHGGTTHNMTFSERTPRNSEYYHGHHHHHHHNHPNDTLMGPPQSQSKMRRAFSNAQLTLATTFGFGRQYQSRTNLGQINENSSMMASPRVSCDPAALANMTSVGALNTESESTPKRGIRARLTSATFLNRTLNRNTTLRRQTGNVFAHSERETAATSAAKPPTCLPPKSMAARTASQRVTDL